MAGAFAAEALDAIGLVNKHFRAIADSALLWRLAARALGVQDSCCNDISIRDRVLGACHAEETLFAHGAIAHSRMLATVLPRSGGWVSALFARLETLGLGCTWKPDGECKLLRAGIIAKVVEVLKTAFPKHMPVGSTGGPEGRGHTENDH